jgi:type II secretory pathway pseudopilin PulG
MILAIISFPTTIVLIGVLLAPIAIVLGIIALRKATTEPQVYGGKGFAIAGVSVGGVVCVFFIPVIAAIAIPNLLAARKAANESSAMRTVQQIAAAQMTYSATFGAGTCGDVASLAKQNLVAADLATGRKNGYKFVAKGGTADPHGCEVQATPESRSQGTWSFYYSSYDNVYRGSKDGLPADYDDTPIEEATRVSR